ncbi:hypothetical protein KPH14_001029 [Odynerus spinipes]|uniref:Reverse transcriptase domain-containing protein n=1 Tax=Odynerus spinipes TaxID=1348599 RepID=A0AAD9REL8_9HYME|nr:hypothetical protein KPH14_001029 [Odynerus spinipes]
MENSPNYPNTKTRYFIVKQNDTLSELHPIKSGVPQGSVLGPVLYTLYTADLSTTEQTTTATFADNTAIIASHSNPTISDLVQENLYDSVKYLGMHLDSKLNWKHHIWQKRKQLGLQLRKYYWLLGPNSKLSLNSKVTIYKSILKPVWTYGIQLWGSSANSNVEILERFQSKTLRIITNSPWYITNKNISKDLEIPSVKSVVKSSTAKYSEKLQFHPNILANELLNEEHDLRRLKRFKPLDNITRF